MQRWPRWARITTRVVLGLLATVLALIAILAGSIAWDLRGAQGRLAEVTNATVPGQTGPDVPAYVARPKGEGPHPVVIMVHEFWGLNPDIVSKAELLASEGYLVVAPNVFRGSTTGFLPRAIYQVISTPAEEVNEDLDAVHAWVLGQPEADASRIGITGFCFGGRTSLLYSLHNPTLQATAVFYGQPVTDAKRLETLSGPVLGVFGGADTSIPLEDVRAFETALKDAGVESTVTIYPDQPHAFVKNAQGIASDPVQAEAWREMVGFFAAALRASARLDGESLDAPGAGAPAGDFYGWAPIMRLGLGHLGHASPWDAPDTGHH